MNPLVLSALPLAASGVMCILGRRRWPVLLVAAVTLTLCAAMIWRWVAMEDRSTLFGLEWVLDTATRSLLVRIYAGTLVLFACAQLRQNVPAFSAAALASVGVLTAALLARPLWLASLLLSCGVVLTAGVARPQKASAARGASGLLLWSSLPIPFVLALFALLEHHALYPDDAQAVNLAGLLSIVPMVLWLNLFPVQATVRAWAADGVPLGPVLAWVVRDAVVLFWALGLWQQHPELCTPTALDLLGLVGLLTAVASGILAGVRRSPGSLLACAMACQLGTAVSGAVAGSVNGWEGVLALLAGRWIAAWLAVAALTVLDDRCSPAGDGQISRTTNWPQWAAVAGYSIAILSLAGALPGPGFCGRQQVYLALGEGFMALRVPWALASLGLVVGLARLLPSLLAIKSHGQGQVRVRPSLFLLCALLLLSGYVALRPLQILSWIPVALHPLPLGLVR